jgi:hypothetical protein
MMNPARIDRWTVSSSGLLAAVLAMIFGVWIAPAWAQTSPSPAPPATTPAASEGGWGATGVAVVIVLAALLVVVGAIVKTFDLRRKREAESVHLQAQISDALLQESALAGLVITPTAHIPFWSGSPATIELAGQVPNPELHDLAVRISEREASRIRSDIRIEDRIGVVPTMQVPSILQLPESRDRLRAA